MGFLTKTLKQLQMNQRSQRNGVSARNRFRCRIRFEQLEERRLLTANDFTLNDPDYPTSQWGFNNLGQPNTFSPFGGKYGIDIDMPAAWSITTGKMTTVLAVMDDGVDYTNSDIYLNIWLNQAEIPTGLKASLSDSDSDGLITFRDLNAPANAAFVNDVNANGYIDGGDLLRDARWADQVDGDSNLKIDDLIGWDFQDNDNDPMPGATGGHGTGMAKQIGGIPNNGIGQVGVNWQISMMPVRIHPDGSNINYTNAAAGLDYAVAGGASISNNSWGNDIYSQGMYDAISRAKAAGHLFVAASGNPNRDTDITPFYPASFDHDNIISAMLFDPNGNSKGDWGLRSVDLGAPTPGATSGASANTAGVAALLKTIHPDWNSVQLKDRILSTVEHVPEFAGITVTGGRLNAAFALATTSIAMSTPTVVEGNSGTAQISFTVTRVGDSTGNVTVNWSTADGTATAGSDYITASGQVTFVAGGSNTQTISIGVKGDLSQEPSETFFVHLTLASGTALLADTDGQGTILDDETKFYVVDDATANRTFEYGSGSAAVENYALNSVNSTPRGAASTAAGDRVWVIDANRNVYVYNTSGGILGSWTAGSMNASAQPEGITVIGTDVWVVDNKTDKVFRYNGAASRLSGSQNASSSFSLSNSNTNPKDLVTDGTNIWVVNDNTGTDMVFRYTVSGTLQGFWTISTTSPTGITLDPTNSASPLWIVDNANDSVYQFARPASTSTSGALSGTVFFTLAPGNTNPQGIADPPPPVAFGSMGSAADLQSPFVGVGPMPLFSNAASDVNSVTLQEVKSKVRTTDDFMSVLGLAFEQPKASVSVGRMTTVEPDKSIQLSKHVGAELQDDNMDDLIGVVAHDLWR